MYDFEAMIKSEIKTDLDQKVYNLLNAYIKSRESIASSLQDLKTQEDRQKFLDIVEKKRLTTPRELLDICWNIGESDYKRAIDYIIAGRTRKIDVGCCRYTTDEGEQVRYFMNVVNIGLSANIVGIANKKVKAPFAKYLSHARAMMLMLLHRNSYNIKMRLNNQTVENSFMMLCIGNARGYGMTPSAVPYNGYLDVSAIKYPKFFGLVQGIYMLLKRRIMNYKLMMFLL